MATNGARILSAANAAFTTPEPEPVQPVTIDRTTAFYLTAKDMQGPPPYPTLYDYLTGTFGGVDPTDVPDYIDGMEMLGRLDMVAPSAEGAMLASFVLPTGHPDSLEDQTVPILSLPITAQITDAVVNSGCLTGLDNVVYGRTDEGVLCEVAIFVEVG